MITTSRLRRQVATIRSIIEQHPAFDDDPVAGVQPPVDAGAVAFPKAGKDFPLRKGPGLDLDEDHCAVVIHEQRGIRDEDRRLLGHDEARVGEHVGLELILGLGKAMRTLHLRVSGSTTSLTKATVP